MSTAVVEPEPADVAEVADADAAAAGLTGSAEEDRAATKLQALQRGKKGRAKVEAKKERVLVEKELKRAKKKFERMDKDGNGTLDSEEVQGLAHWVFASFHPGEESLGGGGAGKQLEDMVAKLTKRLDKDGDGRLDFDEFAAWFTRMCEDIYQFRRRLAKQQEVAAAAKQQEVEEKAAARATRRKLRRRAIRLFQDIDVNNDGGLDRDEVLGMLKGDDALSSLMEAVDRSPVYVFEQLDADGDGNVTLAEFLSLVPEEEEEEQTPAPAEEEEEELEPSGAEVTEGMLREGLGDAGTSGNGASMVYLSLALAERELGFLGGLASLSQLQSLDLAGNQIVDSEMAHLDNMPYLLNLNLVGNRLTKFPALAATCNLKSVDISRNSLKSLAGLANHRFVKNLMVDDNRLTSLEGLSHCRCLENLSACRNQLTGTEELASLGEKTLQKLLLADNSITQLSGIDELSSLVLVDVSENELSSLQGLESHPLLCDVFASSNRIDGDLDEQVALLRTLPLLRTLYLQRNGVADEDRYRYRVLYQLPTLLDMDGKQILAEEKVAAQNDHGDNSEALVAVSAKYFPPGNPCDVPLFEGEFDEQ